MRTAEMYLIEAEAYARQGKNTEAQNVLFLLASNRDSKYTKSNKTDVALLDEIILQRRVELWGEGFRWFDLKRMNVPMQRELGNGKDGGHDLSLCGFEKVEASDSSWEWAIPNQELESNPHMAQNP
ncbi:MAG: RagB/SusD family nutrient uptake outer membrane protein [Bacteroidales bacterium]